MAIGKRGTGGRRRDVSSKRKAARNMRERMQCRFCRQKVTYIDYKDVDVLQKLLTQRGKIFSRKRSGNCAGCQRKAQLAIKRARFLGLLPFVS